MYMWSYEGPGQAENVCMVEKKYKTRNIVDSQLRVNWASWELVEDSCKEIVVEMQVVTRCKQRTANWVVKVDLTFLQFIQ